MINWQEHYELGEWHGMDNYQCLHCPFATIDGVMAILDHVQVHADEIKEAPVGEVIVLDSGGNILDSAVADEEE